MTPPFLWIGGAPCAGKSSVARLLGERFALDVVHIDDSFDRCTSRLDAACHPALSRWTSMSWEERWAGPADVLLAEVVSCYREHLGFVLDELATRPNAGCPTIVEGSALLPGDVAPVLADKTEAVWLVPTPEFQTHHYALRSWAGDVVRQCADPAGAFERWMARDGRFAEWLAREVRELGLAQITVDGSQSVDDVADLVARQFGLVRDENEPG